MNIPADLKYTKDHEWVKVEGDSLLVGITDFAQGELGDIVYVEIETEGEEIESGEVFGTIEAVKTVSDLFMPVKGKVAAINESLESDPEKVNSEPYTKGWMIKITDFDQTEVDNLLDASAYEDLIA